eukprot:Sdes_comp15669_c0_seq2m4688
MENYQNEVYKSEEWTKWKELQLEMVTLSNGYQELLEEKEKQMEKIAELSAENNSLRQQHRLLNFELKQRRDCENVKISELEKNIGILSASLSREQKKNEDEKRNRDLLAEEFTKNFHKIIQDNYNLMANEKKFSQSIKQVVQFKEQLSSAIVQLQERGKDLQARHVKIMLVWNNMKDCIRGALCKAMNTSEECSRIKNRSMEDEMKMKELDKKIVEVQNIKTVAQD